MDPTVREFLPWHVVQRKLEARASGVDVNDLEDDYDSGPDSGVQESAHLVAANDASTPALTYKVYTLAELDARNGPDSAPASVRSSMVPAIEAPKPRWLETGQALLAAATTFVRWVAMGKGRPQLALAMRAPGVVLAHELKGLGRDVNWRKLAFVVGVSATTIAVLLFAVITVAELTDDYHAPGAAAAAHLADPSPKPAAIPAAPIAVTDVPPQVELTDDPTPPAPPPTPRKHGKIAKAAPSPKADVEVFIP